MRKIKKIIAIENNLMAFGRKLAIITLSDGEKRLFYQSRYGTRVAQLRGSWSRLPGITLDYAMGEIGWLIKPNIPYYQQHKLQRASDLTRYQIGRMDLSFFSSNPTERDQDIFIVNALNQHPTLNSHLSSVASLRTTQWSNNLMKFMTTNTELINSSDIPTLHTDSLSAPIQSAPLKFHHCRTVSDIIRLMHYCVTQNVLLDSSIQPLATKEYALLWDKHDRIIDLAQRACTSIRNPHLRRFRFMHTNRDTFFHNATEFLKTTLSQEHANTPPLSVLTFINHSATTTRLLPLTTLMEEKKRALMQSAHAYCNTTKIGLCFRPHHPLHSIACELARPIFDNAPQDSHNKNSIIQRPQQTSRAHQHQINTGGGESKESFTRRF